MSANLLKCHQSHQLFEEDGVMLSMRGTFTLNIAIASTLHII
jgi:hypothetical protein